MPTVNDPLDPGKVLNALGKLKALLNVTSEGELAAGEVRTAAIVAARRAMREQAERAVEPNEAKRVALEDQHQHELENVRQRHEARLAWIDTKYHDARTSLTNRIAQERDGKVGKVQAEVLKTQDERSREYAATKEQLGALRERVGEDLVKVRALEIEALKAMRSFKPLLASKLSGKGVKVAMDDGKNLFSRAEESLGHVKSAPLAKLFRFVPLSLWVVATIGVAAWLSDDPKNVMGWLPTAGMAIGGVLVIYGIALASSWGSVSRLAEALQRIRLAGATTVGAMEERVMELKADIQGESAALRGELSETLISSETESQERIQRGREKLETQLARLPEKEERLHARRMKWADAAHAERMAEWQAQCAAEEKAREEVYQEKEAAAEA